MQIISIDPGSAESAFVLLNDDRVIEHGKEANDGILLRLRRGWQTLTVPVAIEGIASYGMPVGKEVFDTCMWSGRFREAWENRGRAVEIIYRREVKLFHCETARANDANIRAALIDRYGPGKDIAIGKKSAPGPLFGLKGDEWSALAIAVAAMRRQVHRS